MALSDFASSQGPVVLLNAVLPLPCISSGASSLSSFGHMRPSGTIVSSLFWRIFVSSAIFASMTQRYEGCFSGLLKERLRISRASYFVRVLSVHRSRDMKERRNFGRECSLILAFLFVSSAIFASMTQRCEDCFSELLRERFRISRASYFVWAQSAHRSRDMKEQRKMFSIVRLGNRLGAETSTITTPLQVHSRG